MMLYQAKVQHAGEEVYMVLKEGDEKKMRYMNYTLKEIGEDVENPPFERIELNVDSLTYGQTAFDTTFFKARDCRKTFLVPYASSKDAGFVYDFLRKLQVEQRECEITVYGMYKWLDYQDEMFDIMNVMDVKLTISNLTNPEDPRVKQFKRNYLTEYGALPTDDALEGYDMIKYLGTKLNKYGNRFHLVDKEPYTGVQTVFDILPETNEEERVDYFQNQFLDLIQIEDFKYDRAYK